MSSLLEPAAPIMRGQAPGANEAKHVGIPVTAGSSAVAPVRTVEEQLMVVTRRVAVTWTLLAANLALFGLMAISQHRLFHFKSDTLLTWGGGLAPRVFGSEWWRAVSHMFVHSDLAHLAGNMLFLLLIGPFVERLVGPVRFALIYLFAGLGGGLLEMGAGPQHVLVGASTAVIGIYGGLIGCCVRGPRSYPWRLVANRAGVLLVYTILSLVTDWLDFEQPHILHLGGFAFGLVGGLLCGHKLQPRAARWRLRRLGVVVAICASLIGLTAWAPQLRHRPLGA
jgi:rhomboid protease GluP